MPALLSQLTTAFKRLGLLALALVLSFGLAACDAGKASTPSLSADDIAAIERNLAGLRAARDLARVSLCDAEFHDLVAAASHQPRLIQVWELLRGQFLLWIACSQRRLGRTAEDIRRTTLAHHSAIVSLIRSRDSEGAVRYVRDLLEVAAHEMRDALARDVRSRR